MRLIAERQSPECAIPSSHRMVRGSASSYAPDCIKVDRNICRRLESANGRNSPLVLRRKRDRHCARPATPTAAAGSFVPLGWPAFDGRRHPPTDLLNLVAMQRAELGTTERASTRQMCAFDAVVAAAHSDVAWRPSSWSWCGHLCLGLVAVV